MKGRIREMKERKEKDIETRKENRYFCIGVKMLTF